MALTVEDILELDIAKDMELVAGKGGLDRTVTGIGIADYEFSDAGTYEDSRNFEANMLVISTLLFAKNDPDSIFSCLYGLEKCSASALFYKDVLYRSLPKKVIDYANEHDFPIVRFSDTYMEQIIFQFLSAIRANEEYFFTEEKLSDLMDRDLRPDELFNICKGITLRLKKYVRAAYIKSPSEGFRNDLDRYLSQVYLNRNLNNKVLLFEYKEGIFALMTSTKNDPAAFGVILDNLLEYLNPGTEDLHVCTGGIHSPFVSMDKAIREAYHTYVASICEEKDFGSYDAIGLYAPIIPLRDSPQITEAADLVVDALNDREHLRDTLIALVRSGGDIAMAADRLDCHHTTVRYRLSKIKEALGAEADSEQDFYARLAFAARAYLVRYIYPIL